MLEFKIEFVKEVEKKMQGAEYRTGPQYQYFSFHQQGNDFEVAL